VVVPDAKRIGQVGEQRALVGVGLAEIYLGAAVLAAFSGLDFAAKSVGDPLHSVADSQNGDVLFQDAGVAFWGVLVVDRTRTAAEDDAYGFEAADLVQRGGTRENGGEDLLLADAPGD
jgi:hypothetical protein